MIIVFPIIPWGYLWQRPQQIASRLGMRGHRVLYLGVREGGAGAQDLPAGQLLSEGVIHLWLESKKDFDLHADELSTELATHLTSQLQTVTNKLDPKSVCFLVQHPAWVPLLENISVSFPASIIYDCMDDVSEFPGTPVSVLQFEQKLFGLANHVIASSDPLCAKIQTKTKAKVSVIKNGADIAAFQPSNKILSSNAEPIIGYYGSFAEWVAVDSIAALARKHPKWKFILAGPARKEDLEMFENIKNVELPGVQNFKNLPQLLDSFDVALIPFKRNALTEAVNPVKVYEYLAAGKPVASVSLPELKPLADVLYLVEEPEQLERAIITALEEVAKPDAVLRKKRRETAEKNSWECRTDQFEEVLARDLGFEITSLKSELTLFEQIIWLGQKENDDVFAKQDGDWRAELAKRDREWRAELDKRDREWRAAMEDLKGMLSRSDNERKQLEARLSNTIDSKARRFLSRFKSEKPHPV